MQAAVMYGPNDIRMEEIKNFLDDEKIVALKAPVT